MANLTILVGRVYTQAHQNVPDNRGAKRKYQLTLFGSTKDPEGTRFLTPSSDYDTRYVV